MLWGPSIRIQSGANGTFGAIKFRFQQGVLGLFANQCLLRNDCTVLDLAFWIPYHIWTPVIIIVLFILLTSNTSSLNYYTVTSFNIEMRGAKMAYCANYKGHNSFSLLHQRGNHPFSPFTTVSTLSSFSLFLPPPRLPLTKLQYDDIEA